MTDTPAASDLRIDFAAGPLAHRLRFGGGRSQALARAIGMKTDKAPSVVDATAGLGRDAFVLAALGAHVTLIERSATMHALLKDGMDRARDTSPELAAIMARMTLVHGDALELLPALHPPIVYIDPMHPPRKKATALVKKELRLVRRIVGNDEDSPELIRMALLHARRRVVLKWPKNSPLPQGIRQPSHQIIGKSTRYDVFLNQGIA